MSDTSQQFMITPEQISTDEFTYIPNISVVETDVVLVTISISHQEMDQLLLAKDVTVKLSDKDGKAFSSSDESTGELVQVGGGLGVTSSYDINFHLDGRTPKTLTVEHAGATSTFEIEVK